MSQIEWLVLGNGKGENWAARLGQRTVDWCWQLERFLLSEVQGEDELNSLPSPTTSSIIFPLHLFIEFLL